MKLKYGADQFSKAIVEPLHSYIMAEMNERLHAEVKDVVDKIITEIAAELPTKIQVQVEKMYSMEVDGMLVNVKVDLSTPK